jgi:hypothetical protein
MGTEMCPSKVNGSQLRVPLERALFCVQLVPCQGTILTKNVNNDISSAIRSI